MTITFETPFVPETSESRNCQPTPPSNLTRNSLRPSDESRITLMRRMIQ